VGVLAALGDLVVALGALVLVGGPEGAVVGSRMGLLVGEVISRDLVAALGDLVVALGDLVVALGALVLVGKPEGAVVGSRMGLRVGEMISQKT
jgi:hypothetical protein